MKNRIKKWSVRIFLSLTVLLPIIFWACGFEWYKDRENIKCENYVVKAGEYANFEIEFEAAVNSGQTDRLVLAIQVPKVWNPREIGNIVATYEITTTDPGIIKETELIPVGTSPIKQPGLSWEQHLLSRFSDQDPNVLDDMQWVTFVGKERHVMPDNSRWNVKAKFKVKTGDQNLKAKIGFCVYHENEGGGDIGINPGNDYNHYIVDWSSCFEVTDGEGDVIDFCDLHFNQQTPGLANQNDILTFRYIGDIADNDLLGVDDIYINMTATTTTGVKYVVSEKAEKTKLMKESTWGLTYGKTFWPEGYFKIAVGETLESIEYYFTNSDGTKYVSLYDDLYKTEPEENPTWTEKPLVPFLFNFQK